MSHVVRVEITDGVYVDERDVQFDTVERTAWSPENVYDVPVERVDRWETAERAWAIAQGEMQELVDTRAAERLAAMTERYEREAEGRRREDARRAEIRAGLYGGRKR